MTWFCCPEAFQSQSWTVAAVKEFAYSLQTPPDVNGLIGERTPLVANIEIVQLQRKHLQRTREGSQSVRKTERDTEEEKERVKDKEKERARMGVGWNLNWV